MKKSITFTVAIFLGFISIGSLSAQEIKKGIGLRLRASEGSDIIIRKYQDERKSTRYRFGIGPLSLSDLDDGNGFTLNLGFAIGFERRKEIKEKLYFIRGWEPGMFMDNDNLRLNLGYILGFAYDLNEHITLGVDFIPSIGGNITEDAGASIDLGINNNAGVSLTYRFSK